MNRYVSKVISRDHLEKVIIFFKLKDVNLKINCKDTVIDTTNFDINKYEFDENNEIIISVANEYIGDDFYWKEFPKYDNYKLWEIYGSDNYLLIHDSYTGNLPSILSA